MSLLNIRYLIAISDDDDFSPFQGYSTSFLDWISKHTIVKNIIANYPPTIPELYGLNDSHLQLRIAGKSCFQVLPLMVSEFEKNHFFMAEAPFEVIFVNDETKDAVKPWVDKQAIPPLVFEIELQPAIDRKVGFKSIREYVSNTVKLIKEHYPEIDTSIVDLISADKQLHMEFEIPIKQTNHNTNWPNDLSLISCGGAFEGVSSPVCGKDAKYVEKIMESSGRVAAFRNTVPEAELYFQSPPMPSLIFTSASSYAHIKGFTRKALSEPEKQLGKLVRLLARQSTYALQMDEEFANAMKSNPSCMWAIQTRALELGAFTDALALRAASYLTPVLRVPDVDSEARYAKRKLVDSMRAMNKIKASKLPRLANDYFEKLTVSIPDEFVDILKIDQSAITVVSDTPYELADIDGIPLMLRQIVNRINSTPGNVAFLNTIPHQQLDVRCSDIGEVLVIRSFDDDDPLKNHLETSVSFYELSNGNKLPVKFVDVENQNEFIGAVNSATGLFLVLDCHGSHKKNDDIAYLHLKDEKVNVWELQKKVQFPPIVFACACDTSALDRSHVSVSAGLLGCGARTVIGTSLPIHSIHAAVYVARLLFRVFEFLPAITKTTSIRWHVVFGLLQRMVFVSEVLRLLEKEFKTHWKTDLQTKITEVIHTRGYRWYEDFLSETANEFGTTTEEIETIRRQKMPFPESYKYIQFGNPETIVFHRDD